MMLFVAVIITVSLLTGNSISENQHNCFEPLDLGNSSCKDSSQSFRYYYDKHLRMCLPFGYNGCGGGSNSFGMLADASYCSGGVRSLRRCSSTVPCPAGSSCQMGAFKSGVCCSDQMEAEWKAALNPKCAKGSVLKIHTHGGLQTLLGRSCQHKFGGFCPLGFQCVQGKYLAHCCAPQSQNIELVGQ